MERVLGSCMPPCHHFPPEISSRAGLTRVADNGRFLLRSVFQTTQNCSHLPRHCVYRAFSCPSSVDHPNHPSGHSPLLTDKKTESRAPLSVTGHGPTPRPGREQTLRAHGTLPRPVFSQAPLRPLKGHTLSPSLTLSLPAKIVNATSLPGSSSQSRSPGRFQGEGAPPYLLLGEAGAIFPNAPVTSCDPSLPALPRVESWKDQNPGVRSFA